MSQINCADSAKIPSFGRAMRAVGEWIDLHSSASMFDPQQLSRELPQFGVGVLSVALSCLAEDGDLRPVFMVKTPSGVLAEGIFSNPESIPDEVRDRFDHAFRTSGSEIVPMFEFVKRR